jgi:hypothetical protein
MDYFFNLLLSALFTAIAYMSFPLLRIWINMGKFERKQAHRIALWNSIVLGISFFFLTIFLDAGTWRATPAILYYWINKAILTEKTIQRDNIMNETEKTESGSVQHCYTRIEYDPKKSQHDYIKQAEQELNLGDPAQQPVTKAKPAPKQEDVIRELQKQVKMQELSRLSQMYNEKLCKLKRNSRIRWILTFCGFALVYFGVLVIAFPDAEVGLVGLLAVIFTAIHFLINASIFGWLIKKRKSDEKQLEPIIKKLQELEKSLNK